MKKILAALMLAAVTLQSVGFAAKINTIEFEGGYVVVSGTAQKGSELAITAVKKDTSANVNENVGLVYQMNVGSTGEYSLKFEINDLADGTDMSGWYTLKAADTTTDKQDFYFATKSHIDSLISDLKTEKEENDLTGFTAVLENEDVNVLKVLGIDLSPYSSYKSSIITELFNHMTLTDISGTTVYNDYTMALGYVLINNGNADGLEKYNPSYENASFNNIASDEDKTFIKTVVQNDAPYTSYDLLEASYKKAYALCRINNANSSKLPDELAKYAALLGISSNDSYKTYKSESASVKSKITQDIVGDLSKTKAYSVSELTNVIKTAVANNPEPSGSGSSSSSGGGGGGGGFSSKGYATKGEVTTVVEQEENKTDSNVFNDLASAEWAETAILDLYKKGIVGGVGDNLFEPDRSVSREEFVKMLVCTLDVYDENAECDFIDVSKDDWFYTYVASAYNSGIVTGYEDNSFGVGRPLTREEAAAMLSRSGKTLAMVREYAVFTDEGDISDWAEDAVKALYRSGVINGYDGKFNPRAMITRAEAAQMLWGFINGGAI